MLTICHSSFDFCVITFAINHDIHRQAQHVNWRRYDVTLTSRSPHPYIFQLFAPYRALRVGTVIVPKVVFLGLLKPHPW